MTNTSRVRCAPLWPTAAAAWAAGAITFLTAVLLSSSVLAQDASTLSPQDIEQFLLTAEIVDARPIGKGVTNSWRLTLSDGATTHDAAFQSIEVRKKFARVGRRTEMMFADSYHFNIAAYRLTRLLGLEDMVPVSVERRWRNRPGALTWWIDTAWDESERVAERLSPPDVPAWSRQAYRMVVFSQLIYDTDRNRGNLLYTADWNLWLIDFTRAFRLWHELPSAESLVRYEPPLLERLVALDKRSLAGGYGWSPDAGRAQRGHCSPRPHRRAVPTAGREGGDQRRMIRSPTACGPWPTRRPCLTRIIHE